MKKLTHGILPTKEALLSAQSKDSHYQMELTRDMANIAVKAINQGIDSHLEAVFFKQYDAGHKLGLKIEATSLHTFLRRLCQVDMQSESDDRPEMDLVGSILQTLGFEWV